MTENFENVNHLVLNFYPDGYSIAVKLNEFPVFTSETILETAKISYEETSLLDYIENEELPPLLVEMIDGSPKLSQYKIWHNGCLILEVRDKTNINNNDSNYVSTSTNNNYSVQIQSTAKDSFHPQKGFTNLSSCQQNPQWIASGSSMMMMDRDQCVMVGPDTERSPNKNNDSYFILLKPTNLSMLNDVFNLTESNSWSTQDRLQLESQIVLHNSPPLFLEPDASKQPPEQSLHWPNTKISNSYTRHKKSLPHSKLKKCHLSKLGVMYNNYNYKSTYISNGTNTDNNNRSTIYQTSPESLPPELTLQHFLATTRAKRNTFAAGHLARFHRFKKNPDNKIK